MAIPILKLLTIGILPSPIKKAYYRARGAKIGKRVSLSILSVLNCENIEIGDDVKVGMLCFVNARRLRLGNRSQIRMTAAIDTGELVLGADSVIMEQVVVGGMLTPQSKLIVGKRVKVFPYSFLNTTKEIFIEDDVGVGGGNYIFTHGTWPSALDGYPYSFGPVTIKKGTWLPWRVFIMPNVTIGENSIIAAGSTVTKDIPDLALAGGSPAKVLRENGAYIKAMSDVEKRSLLENIFSEFAEHYLYLGSDCIYKQDETTLTLILNRKHLILSFDHEVVFKQLECASVYVSFNALRLSERERLAEKSIAWFDIANKETDLSDNPEWILMREYFSRYGIRFNVVNESDIK